MTAQVVAGLTTRCLGAPDAPLVALLHGVTAPGDQLVPLAEQLAAHPELRGLRFAVPEAPIELEGFAGGRSWWPVPLGRLVRARALGQPNDLTRARPAGMSAARAQLDTWLRALVAAAPGVPTVLVGHSQGAMLAVDFALHHREQVAGLVLLSGTIVGEDDWTPRLPQLRGLPVLLTHGTDDPVLLHATAMRLRDAMHAAGAHVTWLEYPGGHEIAPAATAAAAAFLARLFSAASWSPAR